MKKIIFLSLTFGFVTAVTTAQTTGNSIMYGQAPAAGVVEERAKAETDKLNNVVNLWSDQYNQVMQVNRQFFSQQSAMGNGGRAARLSAGREQQLKGILTAEQWQKYQDARARGQY